MVVVRRLIVLLMLRPTWFGFVVVGVVMVVVLVQVLLPVVVVGVGFLLKY